MTTVQITLEMPVGALSALRQDPDGFAREMRVAAAAKWYENGTLSQSKAAEIAGLSRSEFLDALNQYRVTPFQASADEIVEEVADR